ncbi:DMT family transporter [Tropicimonas sediminicola]|uniref:EamA domain-containing membrane protein RarD n=1 Tax=Tropicimonas sediminicola TaxID=1031541 RepID=A0A239ECW2_9RHOB|nr:DMT family transporter [Tropicimonas sediminicola]SNS41774.1 EamA domain-containing membrane protein RarD [Tropicimonas sediminicola]
MYQAHPLRAALWMCGAIASFSLMAVAGRAVSLEHDTFEILLYRSIVSFGIVLVVGGAAGALGQVTTRNMKWHLARNLSHFTAQNLWFYALAILPLAQVIAVEFTSPIWVALLAPLVLGERLTAVRALAALIGFVGVLMVVRPQVGGISPAMVAVAISAVGFAGSALFTRRLTRTETITCIMFWLTLMQAVMGLICAGIDGDITLPSARAMPWLALIGVTGLAAHFCLSSALAIAPAAMVMPMDFMRLPVMALIGLLVYSEPVDAMVVLGALVIFGANWLNLRVRPESRRPETAT